MEHIRDVLYILGILRIRAITAPFVNCVSVCFADFYPFLCSGTLIIVALVQTHQTTEGALSLKLQLFVHLTLYGNKNPESFYFPWIDSAHNQATYSVIISHVTHKPSKKFASSFSASVVIFFHVIENM